MKNRCLHFVLIFCFAFFFSLSNAQSVPPLERVVTLTFTNEKIEVVLSNLSRQANFTFSYNPAILDNTRLYNGSYAGKSVREILNQLFAGTIQYKERGNNYIILTRAPTPPQKSSVTPPLIISGYVANSETGEKLPDVSIYDKKTLSSVITNEYGYFKLKIDKPSDVNSIAFNKLTYKDTVINLNKSEDQFVTMMLQPAKLAPPKVDVPHDTLVKRTDPVPDIHEHEMTKSQINMTNIKDTLYSTFQISLLPFVGSHHVLSGNVINDYSINIIGGYNLGVKKLELGAVFNVNRGDVQHVQLAGVFNAVNGNVNGLQGGGTLNVVRGRTDGVQMAGVLNANLGGMQGPQFAGVLNVNGRASQGAQFAGVLNVQVQDYKGPQFAGVLNVATHGIQGAQIAGVLNYATRVRGTQIGLINVSDSIHGVPVGLLSFVNHGYHKIELSADEIFYTNLAFRTGVRQFYNIFSASIKPDNFGDPFWAMGYGIGTAPRISNRLALNFDLLSSHVSQGHLEERTSLLSKFYVGIDVKILNKLSLTAGATLNGYLTERGEEYPSIFTNNTPRLIYDDDVGNTGHLQMWWGWKVGIRFL